MSIRISVAAATAAAVLAIAGSPAKSADITTNLGLISVAPGSPYSVFLDVTYDPTGSLAILIESGGPATTVQGFDGKRNFFSTSYPTLANPGTYNFTFSVSQGSVIQVGPGPDTGFGSETENLMLGHTVVAPLNGDSYFLEPSTTYTMAISGSADVPTQSPYGLYELQGQISAVPLPASLPIFAATIAMLAGLGVRKSRRTRSP